MPLNPDGLGNTERFSSAAADSLDTEEQSITSADTGETIGKWKTDVDPHPYDDTDEMDYVHYWEPDADQNYVPLGVKKPGGIMAYNADAGRWEEFIKMFGNGSPVIASEIPGAALALESEDESGGDVGGVDIRTGFPGDKRKRFAVWNDTTDADTDTVGSDDRAWFDALDDVSIYGASFRLWTNFRGSSGVWCKFSYDGNNNRGVLESVIGDYIDIKIGDNTVASLENFGFNLRDDAGRVRHAVWSSEPANPQTGDEVVQDGDNWDPAGTGQEEKVCYLNGSWTQIS